MVPLVQPLHLTESTRDNGVDNDCDDGREGGPSVKEGKGSPDCRDSAGRRGGKDADGIGAQEAQKLFSYLWDHSDKSLPSLPGAE